MKNLKKAFSLITCLAVLISAFSLLAVSSSAQEAVHVWDGTTVAEGFAGGDGSEGNPYLISTPEQLAYFAKNYTKDNSIGKTYKLTADIYLNKTDGSPFTNVWVNNKDESFNGVFDGDGHTIYGLYVPESVNANMAGFIPYISGWGATVKNVRISHSELHASNVCGALIGRISEFYSWDDWDKAIFIEKCFIDSTVTVVSNNEGAGGILGMYGSGNMHRIRLFINDCASLGKITSNHPSWPFPGGIIGWHYAGEAYVSRCYAVGSKAIAAPNGYNYNNVYSTVQGSDTNGMAVLNDDQMKSENAKANMVKFDFDTVWRTVEGGYPELRIFPEKTAEPVKGDINGDGELGSDDLIVLRKILLSVSGNEIPESANINGDENVDILDLIALKKMIANVA